MAGGQSYSTITTLTTTTKQVTVPIFSQSAATTTTLTRTGTSTIYSLTSFTVQGAEPRKCYIRSFSYDASAGDVMQGKWTSNYVINFYILSASDYGTYKTCEQPLGRSSTYLAVSWATSYSLNWVVPESGTVYFVFENYATGSDTSVERTVSFTLYKIGALASASTLYTTVGIPSVDTTTVTLTSISYSTLPSSVLASANWITLLAAVVVVVGAILLVLLLTRRARLTKAKAKESRPSGAEKIAGKVFCMNCGAELPSRSKFCNKCGSSQQ